MCFNPLPLGWGLGPTCRPPSTVTTWSRRISAGARRFLVGTPGGSLCPTRATFVLTYTDGGRASSPQGFPPPRSCRPCSRSWPAGCDSRPLRLVPRGYWPGTKKKVEKRGIASKSVILRIMPSGWSHTVLDRPTVLDGGVVEAARPRPCTPCVNTSRQAGQEQDRENSPREGGLCFPRPPFPWTQLLLHSPTSCYLPSQVPISAGSSSTLRGADLPSATVV